MEIRTLTPDAYQQAFPKTYQVFNSVAFLELHRDRAEKLHYLTFSDSKLRFGLVLGQRGTEVFSPFSSPFGGFEFRDSAVRLSQIDAALQAFDQWMLQQGLTKVTLMTPPFFYASDFLEKYQQALFRFGYQTESYELSFHFETEKLKTKTYEEVIWYNARKNLKQARKYPWELRQLEPAHAADAYNVIAQNRAQRGFPLRLSLNQLQAVTEILPVDYWLLSLADQAVAAAVVYKVSDTVVQIIYWGELTEFAAHRPMNYLAEQLFIHYYHDGFRCIDLGQSTVDSQPNYGLCEFKESIGCSLSHKKSLVKTYESAHL